MEVRGYGQVFELERRIYSIDSLRLNPGGIPVRSIGYFVIAAFALAAATRLPFLGPLAARLPWYLRLIFAPLGCSLALGTTRVEGRSPHHTAYAIVRYYAQPRCLAGLRRCSRAGGIWQPGALVVLTGGAPGGAIAAVELS